MGLSEYLYRLFVLPIYDQAGDPMGGSKVFAKIQYLTRFIVYFILSAISFSSIYAFLMYFLYILCKYLLMKSVVLYDLRQYSYKCAIVLVILSSLFSLVCCNVNVNEIVDILEE